MQLRVVVRQCVALRARVVCVWVPRVYRRALMRTIVCQCVGECVCVCVCARRRRRAPLRAIVRDCVRVHRCVLVCVLRCVAFVLCVSLRDAHPPPLSTVVRFVNGFFEEPAEVSFLHWSV